MNKTLARRSAGDYLHNKVTDWALTMIEDGTTYTWRTGDRGTAIPQDDAG